MELLNNLNPPQRQAVTYLDGPVLILAGAGSGKTRVLTHRLAYITGIGACPLRNILAVTFTNKAAAEMKQRVAALLHRPAEGLWIGTFHSVCARILRKDGFRLGYGRDFTIYDESDKLSLIKKAMSDLAIPERRVSPQAVISRISGAKDQMIGPEEYQKTAYDFFEKEVARIYPAYQQALLNNQAIDFDDLLVNAVRLFQENPATLEEYTQKFKHILVDEYQDTNHAQYLLIKLLSVKTRRLCVVGDDDQSIYGFRGADIRNILEFEKDFPEAKVIRLEQNYRSTKTILECANQVVKNNLGRKGKNLWTENLTGEKAALWQAWDERDEAEKIALSIKSNLSRGSLKDMVVLYRTNAQSRALEDACRRYSLPYLIVGGVKFYERKEIKDLLAYLKATVNHADGVSLKRIVNEPPRGLGDASLMRIEAWAAEQNINLYQALGQADQVPGLGPGIKVAAKNFHGLMEELKTRALTRTAEEVLKYLVEKTGYLKYLKGQYSGSDEADSRAENVGELAAAANDFCQRSEDKSLPAFLAEVSLVADIDRWDPRSQAVTLMTMHNAKGLEFDHVYIAGLEDGLLPHSASVDSRQKLEEERRLFYVAITRAKKSLHLCLASSRRCFGGLIPAAPSRFLAELPRELLEVQSRASQTEITRTAAVEEMDQDIAETKTIKGKAVWHSVWGRGQVVEVEGDGQEMKLSIVFSGGLRKKVLASFVVQGLKSS
ncbi:UvrD-helicase domain-containing protein [candidate division TA06 bacterium]|uniref:DNA 3'-5' helicase n=1 Tax=candidate division TA06 bacterium TaxID=2250710 RepID=A0A933IBN8_UNCT6|nr:UvrD-helicase domain-containing protein [candidate division TA06 bacterium]